MYTVQVNSVFGKTIEKVTSQKTFKLASSKEQALELNNDPLTVSRYVHYKQS